MALSAATSLHFEYAGRSEQGDRPEQQDAYAAHVAGDALLMVLCDGMGMDIGGAVASKTAAEAFLGAASASSQRPWRRLSVAMEAANAALADEKKRRSGGPDDMTAAGTTLVAAQIEGDRLDWASIGDSLLYLWRSGVAIRLNADHSHAYTLRLLARAGDISANDAAQARNKNMLHNLIEGGKLLPWDSPKAGVLLEAGDRIALMSDGVTTSGDAHIQSILSEANDAADAARELVEQSIRRAREAGGAKPDNTTALVYEHAA